MAPKLKFLKDSCSNSVINKTFKNQRKHFSNGLLSKLPEGIKFGCKSNFTGKKCGQKEVLGEKEKTKLKRIIPAKNLLSQRTLAKKFNQVFQSGISINNLLLDKENWL